MQKEQNCSVVSPFISACQVCKLMSLIIFVEVDGSCKLIASPILIDSNLLHLSFTVLFTNMRILQFKSQLMIAFLAAVNHLNRPLRKHNFTLMGSKGHDL